MKISGNLNPNFQPWPKIAELHEIVFESGRGSLKHDCSDIRNYESNILQRRKLAGRRADPKDRRRHAIFLTKEGQALLRKASQTHTGLENGLKKRLHSGDTKGLLDTLAALR